MMFVLGIFVLLAKDAILLAISNETEIRRPEILSNIIFTQPYTTVKHLTVKNVYAENTARAYLNKLAEMSILEKRTIQGHHYYLDLELCNILSK